VEATAVEARGRITHGDTGIWDDAHIPGLARIAAFVRSQGALPALQLAHAGRKASMARPWYGNGPLSDADFARGERAWDIVAPTSEPLAEGWLKPRAIDERDERTLIDAYRAAVRRAIAAGFEVLEVHAAHGYLLHSFLSPISNRRNDEYGGSYDGRMRFPLEVARAVRSAIPKDMPLGARITGHDWIEGGLTASDAAVFAAALKDAGVDFVCVSSGGVSADARPSMVANTNVPFAETVKAKSGVPTRAVGLIATPKRAEAIVAQGKADMIALARAMLDNPHWGWHAAKVLDAEVARPKQYQRAAPKAWPGAMFAD
jgi:2,4-dienoyl-CoA reductase-like NADH-dependent reductase (Old Yellow Enzyme family)